MTMTLEQVKNQLRHRSDDPDYRTLTNETANEMADAIDAYFQEHLQGAGDEA